MPPSAPAPHAEAVAHLTAAHPVWQRVIAAVGECDLLDRRRATAYEFLVRALVAQQISVAAAASVFARLCEPHGGSPPPPAAVLAMADGELRAAGLSRQKASYLHDLALAIEEGRLDTEGLDALDDDEVIARVTAVKGFGRWSAEVFLMLQLGRPDVLPAADLGLRRAVRIAWDMEEPPGETELRRMAAPWRPWRSVASWYLWASLRAAPA